MVNLLKIDTPMKYMYNITQTTSLSKTKWSEHGVIDNRTRTIVTDSSKKRAKIRFKYNGNN